MRRVSKRIGAVIGATVLAAGGAAAATVTGANAATPVKQTHFTMVRSATALAAKCLPKARAEVYVTPGGPVETMVVKASGLPAHTDFDLFVIQVPNAKFGVSWYQGDLETDAHGKATGKFIGRFSIETFAVAPGVESAPVVHHKPIPDASSNPAFNPIHTYHLGLWFNSPTDAVKANLTRSLGP